MGIREELFGMAVVASGVCSSKLMLGGRSRLMRLPAVHGIIAPRGDSSMARRVYYFLFPLSALE